MSEHEFENYLTLISRFLRLSRQQQTAIGEELRDHMESRLADLIESGLPRDEAVRRALEEFGDASGLAAQFARITHTRNRRWIMRCTVASVTGLAAAVFVALAIWPDHHAGRVINTATAESKDNAPQQSAAEQIDGTALDAETQAKLNGFFNADFVGTPLTDVLSFFSDHFKVQFYLDDAALKDQGVDPSTSLITLALHHIRGKLLIETVLKRYNLGYVLKDGIMFISTQDKLDGILETRVYDCRKILAADKTPAIAPTPTPPPSLFDSKKGEGESPKNRPVSIDTPETRLIDLLTETVSPQNWSTEGGHGTITIYNGLLVVSQTADVQGQVADLLEQISSHLDRKEKN